MASSAHSQSRPPTSRPRARALKALFLASAAQWSLAAHPWSRAPSPDITFAMDAEYDASAYSEPIPMRASHEGVDSFFTKTIPHLWETYGWAVLCIGVLVWWLRRSGASRRLSNAVQSISQRAPVSAAEDRALRDEVRRARAAQQAKLEEDARRARADQERLRRERLLEKQADLETLVDPTKADTRKRKPGYGSFDPLRDGGRKSSGYRPSQDASRFRSGG